MLELRNIVKVYQGGTVNETCLFNDFSLSIPERQFVCVVGSNGSGKTSLLNIICGSIPIEGGDVLVGGKSSLSAAAALAFRLVVHRHVHIEVPDIVGEDELGLRQGLFLVHLDFQRGGGCHSAKAHGHGAVRLDRLHRRLFHSTDQLIDVKRQMYHLAF